MLLLVKTCHENMNKWWYYRSVRQRQQNGDMDNELYIYISSDTPRYFETYSVSAKYRYVSVFSRNIGLFKTNVSKSSGLVNMLYIGPLLDYWPKGGITGSWEAFLRISLSQIIGHTASPKTLHWINSGMIYETHSMGVFLVLLFYVMQFSW